MPAHTIASLAKPLLSLAPSAKKIAKRLYAERKAAFGGTAHLPDFLETGFDDTIQRFRAPDFDEAWWKRTLLTIEQSYTSPEFLRKQGVRDWLNEPDVRVDLKWLARQRILDTHRSEDARRKKLEQKFVTATGENKRFAGYHIDAMLAVLVAGFAASVDRGLRPLAGLVQAAIAENRTDFDRIDATLDSIKEKLEGAPVDPLFERFLSNVALDTLRLIKMRRAVSTAWARVSIQELADRVLKGDLSKISNEAKAQVLFWAVRITVSDTTLLPTALRFRQEMGDADFGFMGEIADALLAEAGGDPGSAISLLRDIDDADARWRITHSFSAMMMNFELS